MSNQPSPHRAESDASRGALKEAAPRPFPFIPWVSAVLVDLTAALLLFGHGTRAAVFSAGALHLAALAPILVARALAPSERALGAAFAFAIPILGAPLAALSLGTAGRGELLEADPDAPPPGLEPPRAEELRRLGEALPTC